MSSKMTPTEKRTVVSLASIMGLRMIGLFMVLPMFTLYARHLEGATPTLIGIAVGIYGLTQALFQIPFGSLSDRLGRKPIILIGLIIFTFGSFLAAISHSISLMIIARALQGVGAVGSTILAMMADMTREDQRTKSMAIAGMSIGFSFMLAMLIGPILANWFSVSGLFYLAALMGVITIIMLYTVVPTPQTLSWHKDAEPEMSSFLQLFIAPELAKLNCGIFILHAIFTASFVVIPIALHQFTGMPGNQQWRLYLPALVLAFLTTLVCIGIAESKRKIKPFFLGGIATLIVAELVLWSMTSHLWLAALGLGLFFCGFSLLEAFLPSLISRTAPPAQKGSALGIFSCAQFSGIFVGGALGGWLFGQFSFIGVYVFCIILALFWLSLATLMQPPQHRDFLQRKEQLQSES